MEVTSDAISGTMSREHVTLIPSWTRRPAWARFSGLIKLRVPSSSSGPQRSQLLREVIQPSTSSSVGSGVAIRIPPSLVDLRHLKSPWLFTGDLLRGGAPINDQLTPRDKGRFIGGQI